MRIRMFLAATAIAVLALSAFGLSADFIEWGRGPAQFLMTKEEAAQWQTISSDDDAKRFIALFWARRDPTPETPLNEFRLEYEKRVATADKNFASEGLRGALSDRGRMFILFGMPKKIERTGAQRDAALPQGITMGSEATGEGVRGFGTASSDPLNQGGDDKTAAQVWTYEGDEAREMFGVGRAVLRFVDKNGKEEYLLQQGRGVDVPAARDRMIAKGIVNPGLTEPPMFATAAAIPAEPVAPAVQTELTTESLKAAVNEFKAAAKSPYAAPSYATFGEYVTSGGDYFVPVQLYVPKVANVSPDATLTFFGVVQDETGKNVLAFEEPATITASKDDLFVERSLLGLSAGKLRGYFGLAENGKPVTVAAADMQLAGVDPAAPTASGLILSNNVYPLSAAQAPTDPFAFGGLKVVPKGDKTFRPADELWYFVELRNPGVAEPAAAAVPVTGDAAAPAGQPKVQIKVDVEGTDASGKKIKMSAPPREVEAIAIKGVPNHYGVGSAIPLSSFKPGEYTMNVKVIDTVKKASYSYSEKFRVVE